jgi:hypothetical protein
VKVQTTALLALGTVAILGRLAFAQGEGADNQLHPFAFLENLSMVIMPDGHGVRSQITNPAMSDMILKNAKPVTTALVFFMHDGKLYMTKDERGPSGRMLSAMIMHPKK